MDGTEGTVADMDATGCGKGDLIVEQMQSPQNHTGRRALSYESADAKLLFALRFRIHFQPLNV
jgi:hypothetical protein